MSDLPCIITVNETLIVTSRAYDSKVKQLNRAKIVREKLRKLPRVFRAFSPLPPPPRKNNNKKRTQ